MSLRMGVVFLILKCTSELSFTERSSGDIREGGKVEKKEREGNIRQQNSNNEEERSGRDCKRE